MAPAAWRAAKDHLIRNLIELGQRCAASTLFNDKLSFVYENP